MGGGVQADVNGKIIEELMDERELVSLNDGSGTRINLVTGMEYALDLTLVSNTLAGSSRWEVWATTTLGSDHWVVITQYYAEFV